MKHIQKRKSLLQNPIRERGGGKWGGVGRGIRGAAGQGGTRNGGVSSSLLGTQITSNLTRMQKYTCDIKSLAKNDLKNFFASKILGTPKP